MNRNNLNIIISSGSSVIPNNYVKYGDTSYAK